MSLLLNLIVTNLKRFLLGLLLGGGVFIAVVGGVCYWLMHDEPSWRFSIVAVLVAVGTAIAALLTGGRLAATGAIRDWVDATGVGPMLSKVIFKQALGVSDKRPGGSKELAASLQGKTIGQAKAHIAESLSNLFHSDALDRWLPAQGRWLAKKLTSTAGWAVMQSVLGHIPGTDDDHREIDLLKLRNGLSDGLADKAVTLTTARATALAMGVITVASVVCVVVALLLGS